MIIQNNNCTMLMALAFQPAFSAPKQAGQYLVIDENLRYLTCEAVFNPSGSFVFFQVVGQPAARFKGTEVLVYAQLQSAPKTIQQLYSQNAVLNAVGADSDTVELANEIAALGLQAGERVNVIPMFPERAR